MEYHNITIERPNHDTIVLSDNKVIVIDPFQVGALPKANLVLITHDHYDHLSADDLKNVVDPSKTVIVAPPSCADKLKEIAAKSIEYIKPGDKKTIEGITVSAVPAYNINKFKSPGEPFHPREAGFVGYVFVLGDVTFYHTGDSDFIEEMKSLGPIKVMFVPVSGTYVMTVDEAVEAAKAIKPELAIPMHYGAIVGDKSQAEAFKEKIGDLARVEIL